MERVFSERRAGGSRQLLVKWRSLDYSDSTWEDEADLASEADQASASERGRASAACQQEQKTGSPASSQARVAQLPMEGA